jgi:hypothetical protein
VVTASDYYPFGSQMPGRDFTTTGKRSRHSINGQERSDGLNDNLTTALYWEYDSRIGRRWNPDPVVNISESRYACFGNNPNYYSDELGDFKSKFSAKWYKFWHGEKGDVGQQKEGKGAGEWYISRIPKGAGAKGSGNTLDEVIVTNPIFGPSSSAFTRGLNSAKNWWNSVEWTSQTHLEASVGVQIGVTAKINSLVNVKAEAGLFVNKILDFKADAYDMGAAKLNYGLFEMDELNRYHLQSNFLNISIEAGIPKTALTGILGYDYKKTDKYYYGMYGPQVVDSEISKGWNGNIKLKKFEAKSKIIDTPSGKIGGNNEKKFYGLDVSVGVRLILGVKGSFRIGFQGK